MLPSASCLQWGRSRTQGREKLAATRDNAFFSALTFRWQSRRCFLWNLYLLGVDRNARVSSVKGRRALFAQNAIEICRCENAACSRNEKMIINLPGWPGWFVFACKQRRVDETRTLDRHAFPLPRLLFEIQRELAC